MTPILIPAKSKSIRCPRKNFELLPYTARWLEEEGRLKDAILIYDSDEMRELAVKHGLSTFAEITPHGGDEKAASECSTRLGIDKFFRLPLTQPLRSHGLLEDMEDKLEGFNLVVSAQWVPDRDLFYFDDNGFLLSSTERKGKMCTERLMVDGAAYLTRSEWMNRIKTNADFWSEPFNYAINKMPFLDIDTQEDMEKLKALWNLTRQS